MRRTPLRAGAIRLFPGGLLLGLALAGCGDSSPTDPGDGHTVGPGGATLMFAGDSVGLLIPAGAVSQTVTITVQSLVQFPDSPAVIAGTVYRFGPAGLHFNQPVALGIRYDPAAIPSDVPELELTLGRVLGNNWQGVSPTVLNLADHAAGAAINDLGVYGVMPIPVAAVHVTPASAAIVFDQPVSLAAKPTSAAGDTLRTRTVTWSSSNSLVAEVNGEGVMTGVGPGSATITATSEGVKGTASVSVAVLDFVSVTTGGQHSCGLAVGGAVYCWGLGAALGIPPPPFAGTANSPYPVAVSGGLHFRSLDGGQAHTCAVTLNGGLAYCWGRGDAGQIGDGSNSQEGHETPRLVSGGLIWTSVSAGFEHSCGLTTDSLAYCWGNNFEGTLGNGSSENSTTPVPVSGGLKWIAVEAGAFFSCGVSADSLAYCWGYNASGNLGDGTMEDHNVPTPIAGNPVVRAISTGGRHVCVVATDTHAYCWGATGEGTLGDGSQSDHASPVPVAGGGAFTSISAGNFDTCGVDDGSVGYCWGGNGEGQLGDGSTTPQTAPTPVSGGLLFQSISASLSGVSAHACSITTNSKVYCWGDGRFGELGHGPMEQVTEPLRVAGQP